MRFLIEKLVRDICKNDFRIQLVAYENDDNVISFIRNDYHIAIKLEHISLQLSLKIEEQSIFCLVFPDPIMVNSKNKLEIINFINHVNWLTLAFGHFYVDSYNDIAYAIRIPKYLIVNNTEEVRKEIFEIPIKYFSDIQLPLLKLSSGQWDLSTAIKYIDELYNNGYVCNDDYDI